MRGRLGMRCAQVGPPACGVDEDDESVGEVSVCMGQGRAEVRPSDTWTFTPPPRVGAPLCWCHQDPLRPLPRAHTQLPNAFIAVIHCTSG